MGGSKMKLNVFKLIISFIIVVFFCGMVTALNPSYTPEDISSDRNEAVNEEDKAFAKELVQELIKKQKEERKKIMKNVREKRSLKEFKKSSQKNRNEEVNKFLSKSNQISKAVRPMINVSSSDLMKKAGKTIDKIPAGISKSSMTKELLKLTFFCMIIFIGFIFLQRYLKPT
jgi:ABC-type multidrug transport system fused ATPase/permease subunit